MDKIDMNMAVNAGLGIGIVTYAIYANYEMNQLKETNKNTLLILDSIRKDFDNKYKELSANVIKYKKKVDEIDDIRYNLEKENRELSMQVEYLSNFCNDIKETLENSGIEYENPRNKIEKNLPNRENNKSRFIRENVRVTSEPNKYERKINSREYERPSSSGNKRWSDNERDNIKDIKINKSTVYSPILNRKISRNDEEIDDNYDDDVDGLLNRVKPSK